MQESSEQLAEKLWAVVTTIFIVISKNVDAQILAGALIGSTVFILNEKEKSKAEKIIYLGISAIIGYTTADDVVNLIPITESLFVGAMVSALLSLTILINALDVIKNLGSSLINSTKEMTIKDLIKSFFKGGK